MAKFYISVIFALFFVVAFSSAATYIGTGYVPQSPGQGYGTGGGHSGIGGRGIGAGSFHGSGVYPSGGQGAHQGVHGGGRGGGPGSHGGYQTHGY